MLTGYRRYASCPSNVYYGKNEKQYSLDRGMKGETVWCGVVMGRGTA